jgi:hypothetical protein
MSSEQEPKKEQKIIKNSHLFFKQIKRHLKEKKTNMSQPTHQQIHLLKRYALDWYVPEVYFRTGRPRIPPQQNGCNVNHAPDRRFLDVASLGQSVPWLFCP